MQEQFIKFIKELTENKFYVPSDDHSSGFNECELINLDNDVFLINEEGEEKELTFIEVIEYYPQFTLSKRYAFELRFETWDRFKKALNGEISINLVEI